MVECKLCKEKYDESWEDHYDVFEVERRWWICRHCFPWIRLVMSGVDEHPEIYKALMSSISNSVNVKEFVEKFPEIEEAPKNLIASC